MCKSPFYGNGACCPACWSAYSQIVGSLQKPQWLGRLLQAGVNAWGVRGEKHLILSVTGLVPVTHKQNRAPAGPCWRAQPSAGPECKGCSAWSPSDPDLQPLCAKLCKRKHFLYLFKLSFSSPCSVNSAFDMFHVDFFGDELLWMTLLKTLVMRRQKFATLRNREGLELLTSHVLHTSGCKDFS